MAYQDYETLRRAAISPLYGTFANILHRLERTLTMPHFCNAPANHTPRFPNTGLQHRTRSWRKRPRNLHLPGMQPLLARNGDNPPPRCARSHGSRLLTPELIPRQMLPFD
jgi:hypothetical protein